MNSLLNWYLKIRGRETKPRNTSPQHPSTPLKAGDWVRVRPHEEIRNTLDHWYRLKGCGFANEMAQYCGTKQRVLKPVERFVDERDLRIVRTKGVYLLEDLICQGMGQFGKCDRSCFLFWREEWLEKIDEAPDALAQT